jgi:hypothetical protein
MWNKFSRLVEPSEGKNGSIRMAGNPIDTKLGFLRTCVKNVNVLGLG